MYLSICIFNLLNELVCFASTIACIPTTEASIVPFNGTPFQFIVYSFWWFSSSTSYSCWNTKRLYGSVRIPICTGWLNDKSSGTDNLLIGIQDPDYPFYAEVATPANADDISDCKDTTNDRTGNNCPTSNNRGWYIKLKNYGKATAEPTVNNGLVYFPTYTPSSSPNKCTLGNAFICVADDECGTHTAYLPKSSDAEQAGSECKYVGKGVLSKIVFFAGKYFANISGNAATGNPAKDLVSADAATGEVQTYRKSWRENF